ncbi:MAG: hypothetical protein JNL70_13945 [Saprospiraceae bacterium]|nr:hypothetical protein [Saprospiraceae bacterium]
MKKIQLKFIAFVAIISFWSSCLVSEHDVIPECEIQANGLSRAINDLVPSDILQTIIDLGMPINKGGKPPLIEGNKYKSSPMILLSTNVPGESTGGQYNDYIVTFSQQNSTDLTIKIDFVSGTEKGTGLGSFMAGTGNDFTIFSQIDVESTNQVAGVKAKTVVIMSGTWTPTGIKNFHTALFMLDDKGDPNDVWLENGEGRIFYDKDGFSEKL